jgi:mannose-6-phosphate isomerase-like protein (cupin superfamily)
MTMAIGPKLEETGITTEISPAEGVQKLALMVRSLLLGLTDTHVTKFLADWPEIIIPSRTVISRGLPVLQWLPLPSRESYESAEALLAQLYQLRNVLLWSQTYRAEDFGPEFLLKYGWTELIGFRGPIASKKLACGFLLLGPDVEYPSHHHTAEEVYIVLAGNAYWRCGQEPWQKLPPGSAVYHPSDMPHSMRTHDEPLLALYIWHGGDLTQKSIIT